MNAPTTFAIHINYMKFFIDTASLAQINEAQELGVLDGVTTNPSLMAKEGISGERPGGETLPGHLRR